jgi:hypothetical protein
MILHFAQLNRTLGCRVNGMIGDSVEDSGLSSREAAKVFNIRVQRQRSGSAGRRARPLPPCAHGAYDPERGAGSDRPGIAPVALPAAR